MRRFYDNETDEIVDINQLRAEYETLKANGDTEAEDFSLYLSNCMSSNNGTLEEITD